MIDSTTSNPVWGHEAIGIAAPLSPDCLAHHLDEPSRGRLAGLQGGQGHPLVTLLVDELLRRRPLFLFTVDPAIDSECVLTGPAVRICVCPMRTRHRARDFFRAERRALTASMRRERPALINAHWTYEYALAAMASDSPVLVTAHDLPLKVLKYDHSPYRCVRTLMAWAVARRSPMMTGDSPYTAEYWARAVGRGHIDITPSGVPQSLFDLAQSRPADPDRPITFAMALPWGKLKNGHTGLDAFALLRRRRPDARMLLFGPGCGPAEQAEQWVRRADLTDGVTFVGGLDHHSLLRRLACEADVFVHPSLEESFGVSIVEAMALAIPVIAGARSGAVPWVLDHGRAGVLVDVRRPDALSQAMLDLAADPPRRNAIARAGFDNAMRRFHIARVADAYEQAYRRCFRADPATCRQREFA